MPAYEIKDYSNIELGQVIQPCACSDFLVEAVSDNDELQSIEFDIIFQSIAGETLETRGCYAPDIYASKKYTPGNYKISIKPKLGEKYHDYKHVDIGEEFTKEITLFTNRTSRIVVSINRKESILYDIPYAFYIKENLAANSDKPLIESEFLAKITQNINFMQYYPFANDAASRFGVPLTLVLAIAYMETTHGWYDVALEAIGKNKSILPMNVNVVYWSDLFTRTELEDVHQNFLAGAFLLRRIIDRLDKPKIETIGSLYNSINFTQVQDYGARVLEIHRIFTEKYLK